MMQLFVDLDGVIADFDTEYFRLFRTAPNRLAAEPPDMWDRIQKHGSFFLDMNPMPDADELWNFVSQLNPIILSGFPSSVPSAEQQKRQWVAEHLGPSIPVICCKSKDKCLYAKPGDILIDDWEKYRPRWVSAGGRWITHISAKTTIDQLLDLGIGL